MSPTLSPYIPTNFRTTILRPPMGVHLGTTRLLGQTAVPDPVEAELLAQQKRLMDEQIRTMRSGRVWGAVTAVATVVSVGLSLFALSRMRR